MLPKGMTREKEYCDVCHKEMKVSHSFLRKDESAVEVWYECKCGHKIGYEYWGGFIECYKRQVDYIGQPTQEQTTQAEETKDTQEKGVKG